MFTAREAAEELGVSARTVARNAQQHEIGKHNKFGWWIFTQADIRKLKVVLRGKAGNPHFGKHNYHTGQPIQ